MFARNVTCVKCATFFGTYRSNQHAIVFFLRRHLSRCVPPCPEGSGGHAGSHPAESLVGCLLLEELSLLAGCKLLYLWAAFILLFWQTADCHAALSLPFDGGIDALFCIAVSAFILLDGWRPIAKSFIFREGPAPNQRKSSPSQGPARLQHMARQRWLLPSSSPRGACASK